MVKIRAIKAFRPKNAEEFTIPPYDVISKEQEKELKTNPNSAIHVILPDGVGEEVYKNAKKHLNEFIEKKILIQEEKPSVYIYRQETTQFAQEGLIFAVSIEDYDNGLVKKHEHTREKPLKDRTAHIAATEMNTGLVWTVYKWDETIQDLINKIKESEPVEKFEKYGYTQIVWKMDDQGFIQQLKNAFKDIPLYIADGHHRAAAASNYQKQMIAKMKKSGKEVDIKNLSGYNWSYFMVYAASDEQVRILPYNRVIRKVPLEKKEFLKKVMENFALEIVEDSAGLDVKEHQIGMFYDNTWYLLHPKKIDFGSIEENLTVSILQNMLIEPILGIKDIRKSDNIFFVGGITDKNEMEKYVREDGNAIFFLLPPVKIAEIEDIADKNGVMPPKSTWFDPKLLSGLIFNPLN